MVVRGPVAAAVASLFLLSLFAGCSSKASGSGDLQLANGETVDLDKAASASGAQRAAGKGVVSGVVVDPGIRPLAGVNLTVVGKGLTARTDANGIFVLSNLEPGLYTIAARAAGFLPVQTSAEVKAGETTKVRMVMDADTTPVPYHAATMKFNGFFQASFTGLVDEALDLFVFNQTRGPVTTPARPACTCHFVYYPEPNATTHVIEIAWEANPPKPADPTGQLGDPEIIMHFNPGNFLSFCYGSPCVLRYDGQNLSKDLTKVDLSFWGDNTWPALNEEFTVFVTLFYNGAAPHGWAFTKGDT